MNKKKIFYICLFALAVLVVSLLPSSSHAGWFQNAANEIQAATSGSCTSSNASVEDAETNGMFDRSILEKMRDMMRKIYQALSMVFMMGHSLMCYSIDVAYICIGWEKIGLCFVTIPNFNFLLSGLFIYIVGGLMSLCIGMYFVDVSFKIGFAVIFLPVSIGLWPFKPTHGKLSENLSIVIRNGMLFMMVAIGVSYAVILIVDGMLSGGETGGWDGFWDAIANMDTEALTKDFELSSLRILVTGFCLVFGFKILASSVNDYLNYFFRDSAFGSESPMHHVATQGVGMAANYTVKPALSFAQDVATHQAGRAISGLGSGISKLGSAEGRAQLKAGVQHKYNSAKLALARGAQRAVHPIDTLNAAKNKTKQALTDAKNSAKNATKSAIKSAADLAFIVAAPPSLPKIRLKNGKISIQRNTTTFQERRDKFNASVDKLLNDKQARANLVDRAKNKIASVRAAQLNNSHLMTPTGMIPTTPPPPSQQVTTAQVRQSMHNAKVKVTGLPKSLMATKAGKAVKLTAGKIKGVSQKAVNKVKNSALAQKTKGAINSVRNSAAVRKTQGFVDKKVSNLEKKVETSGQKLETATENFNAAQEASKASGGATYDDNGEVKSKGIIDSAATAAFNIATKPAELAAGILKPVARAGIGAVGAMTGHDTGAAEGIKRDMQNLYNSSEAVRLSTAVLSPVGRVAEGGIRAALGKETHIKDNIAKDMKRLYDTSPIARVTTMVLSPVGRVAEGGVRAALGKETHIKDNIIGDAKTFASKSSTVKAVKAIANRASQKISDLEAARVQSNAQRVADGKSEESKAKFYMKKTGTDAGKVVLRQSKSALKGTAEGTAKVVGNLLQGFGHALGDNRRKHQKKQPQSLLQRLTSKSQYEEMIEREEAKKEAKEEAANYFRAITEFDE